MSSHVPLGGAWLHFVAAAIASFAAFWTVYAAFVLTEPGQRSENLGLLGAVLRSEADRQASLGRLSLISLVSFGLAVIVILLIATLRQRTRLGILAAGIMVISNVAAEILKEVLPRPVLVDGPAWILRNDFPSGHSTIAAAIGVALLLVSPDRLRWLALPAAVLIAGFIGQATQVAGWHRLSGSIGGVLLVVAVASSALVVLARAGLVAASAHGRVNARLRGLLVGLGAVLILLGAIVLGIFVAFPLLRAPEGASSAFLHTVFDALGSGVTVLVLVAFAVTIEPFALGVRRAAAAQPPSSIPPIRPIRPGGP
jgi:membrane-associated phospholipid phosphatase